jgi:hypothetical protein
MVPPSGSTQGYWVGDRGVFVDSIDCYIQLVSGTAWNNQFALADVALVRMVSPLSQSAVMLHDFSTVASTYGAFLFDSQGQYEGVDDTAGSICNTLVGAESFRHTLISGKPVEMWAGRSSFTGSAPFTKLSSIYSVSEYGTPIHIPIGMLLVPSLIAKTNVKANVYWQIKLHDVDPRLV